MEAIPAIPRKIGGKLTAHPTDVREKVFALYARGLTLREIEAASGIKRGTVDKWITRGKWKERKQALIAAHSPIGASVPSGASIASPTVAEIDSLTFDEKQSSYRDRMASKAIKIVQLIEEMPDTVLIAGADKVEKLDKIARKALNLETAAPTIVVNVGLLARAPRPPRIERAATARELPANNETLGEQTGCSPVATLPLLLTNSVPEA